MNPAQEPSKTDIHKISKLTRIKLSESIEELTKAANELVCKNGAGDKTRRKIKERLRRIL